MSTDNRAVIDEFANITGSSKQVAESYLRAHGFSLTQSLNSYFNEPPCSRQVQNNAKSSSKISVKDVKTFFKLYVDTGSGKIESNGIERLCIDLEIDPLDAVWLIIAHRCGAQHMGSFSPDEWERGLVSLGFGNLSALKEGLPSIRDILSRSADEFKEIYMYSFKFSLEPGARNISVETATALWTILLPFSGWKLSDEWLGFIQSPGVVSRGKAVTRDIWNLLLTFARQVPDWDTLEVFDRDGGAWPLIIDEFYDHLAGQRQK